MVDSRKKGYAAELKARNELRKLTGLNWERIPMSGALNSVHKLKGDLYVPETRLKFCVEVKHFAEDHLTSKILTGVNPQFLQWWDQTVREANQIDKRPLLIFKHNRSKWFAAFHDSELEFYSAEVIPRYMFIHPEEISVSLLTDFCKIVNMVEE